MAEAVRGSKPEVHSYNALIDTGASLTSISKNIVDAAGLESRGRTSVASVHGPANRDVYYVDIFIPVVNLWRPRVRVVEFTLNTPAFDALLGMDILCKGLLTVDGPKGEFTFSVQRGTPVKYAQFSASVTSPQKRSERQTPSNCFSSRQNPSRAGLFI
ncbi:MAG: retropepsin-like aspartic protease [Rhodospirillales bacterium]